MSFGGELLAALPAMRGNAESRFTETYVFFTEVVGEDPVTFQPTTVEAVIATTAGRVKSAARDAREVPIGGQFPTVSKLTLSVGVGSVPLTAVQPDVRVRCTASEVDAALVGVVYTVGDIPSMGQVTAWRMPVEVAS